MRIIGIDFGKRRIGIAISDETETIARGLETIDCLKEKKPVSRIYSIIKTNNAEKIVVGYPYRQDGSKGDFAASVDKFISELEILTNMEIKTIDESFSTERAYDSMKQRGIKRKKGKKHTDRIAACYILQSYLDNQN